MTVKDTGGVKPSTSKAAAIAAATASASDARTRAFAEALEAGDWDAVGPLMDASHASLRDDYEVSCEELDVACATARESGAVGARMTGGGFGGSAIALAPAESLDAVAEAVTAAFVAHEWREPSYLVAEAGPGAVVLSV